MHQLIPCAIVLLIAAQAASAQGPREIAKLKHGAKPVAVVVYSPNGKLIASATCGGNTEKNEVRLWDAATNAALEVRFDSPNHVWTALTFSPDNKFLAGANMRQAHAVVWDVATGKEKAKLPHKGSVWAVAWSPDGKLLAASDEFGYVKVWDVSARTTTAEFKLTNSRAMGVAFSPDGKLLATGDHDKYIKLWDLKSKQIKLQWRTYDYSPSLTFSNDGKFLLSGGALGNPRIWDVANGKLVADLKGSNDEVRIPAISPNGQLIATMEMFQTDVILWDRATAKAIATLKGPARSGLCIGLSFSPDGNRLAAGSNDTVTIWDVSSLGEGKAVAQKGEADELQGKWIITAYEVDGKKTPAPNQSYYAFDRGKLSMLVEEGRPIVPGTYKLDAKKTPKQLDLTGTENGVTETLECIYELKGDDLKLASSLKGLKAKRPTSFDPKEVVFIHLKREKASTVIAEARFDKTPDKGWASPWGPKGPKAVIKKIDGGSVLHLSNTGSTRRFTEPQKGRFVVEQIVAVPKGGGVIAYVRDGEAANKDGPVWKVEGNKFFVLQEGKWADTSIAAEADKKHKVVLAIDVSKRTWELSVDGKTFKSAKPLPFRAAVDKLDTVRYQCENVPGIYIDAVRILRSPK
jgi:uncharacterized protein (TIGR03067 family)